MFPLIADSTVVFIVYPIGQGSFSDGMPFGMFVTVAAAVEVIRERGFRVP
jgi:hypothetical protein